MLFEEKVKGRWKGRTPTNKLVFVESDEDLRGRCCPVTWSGPGRCRQRGPTAGSLSVEKKCEKKDPPDRHLRLP